MSNPIVELRALSRTQRPTGFDLVSEVFHRINRIIPHSQRIMSVEPHCTAREALDLMERHGYSQVPVMKDGEVLGVFSYRSFAKISGRDALDHWTKQKCAPGDLRVDEFLEQFDFAQLSDEMKHAFAAIDQDGGILVGSRDGLIGLLTPMDFVRYLHQVASPFVMISEIELSLRALIRVALTNQAIADAARRSLASSYGGPNNVPTVLEDMSFDNYQSLVSNGATWQDLEPLFGGTRTRTSAKLKQIGAIRNALFHFKTEITMRDHEVLAEHRNWLLTKVKQAKSPPALEERT